jgi:hypothetical protein
VEKVVDASGRGQKSAKCVKGRSSASRLVRTVTHWWTGSAGRLLSDGPLRVLHEEVHRSCDSWQLVIVHDDDAAPTKQLPQEVEIDKDPIEPVIAIDDDGRKSSPECRRRSCSVDRYPISGRSPSTRTTCGKYFSPCGTCLTLPWPNQASTSALPRSRSSRLSRA